VSAADIIGLLSAGGGGGTAIVFTALWLAGLIHTKSSMEEKKEEIRELKQALALERQRSDAGVVTGQIVRDVFAGLRQGEISQ
jgi:hypothetical protein